MLFASFKKIKLLTKKNHKANNLLEKLYMLSLNIFFWKDVVP